MIARLKARVFYGWWMVTAALGLQFLTSGLLTQSFGAYVVLLRQDFGWSNTAMSGAYSLQQIESGILGPIQGWIVQRFGPRAIIRVGLLIFGSGFMLFSQIESLAAFYAVFLYMALGAGLGGFFTLTVAIVNWFERKRSQALSTMSVGFALGGVVVPVVAFCLQTFGWRETSFASGVVIIVLGLPLTQVIRGRPEQYGDVVDGIRPGEAPPPRLNAPSISFAPTRDFTTREAMRTAAFWLISLGHGSALLVVSAVNVYAISHLTDIGYSVAAASLVVTLMTTVQVAGMLVGGYLGDRMDKRRIAFACMAMHTAGLLLLAYAIALPMVVAFAVLHGFAWGARGPLMQAIRADYFGRSSFGMIMGVSSIIIVLGTISGPMVAGLLADITGSFRSGFSVLAVLTACGSIFFVLARPPTPPDLAVPSSATADAVASRSESA